MADYTLEEQLIARMAREFKPKDEFAVNGVTYCCRIAHAVAKRLYAPGLGLWVNAQGTSAFASKVTFYLTRPSVREEDIEIYFSVLDIIFWRNIGYLSMWMSAAQVDQYGNANITLIGDKHTPRAVLAGSTGMADNPVLTDHAYIVMRNHSARTFVEKVDFISGAGWVPERERGQMRSKVMNPVFSNLGVFDFDLETHRMRLQSVHKGVKVEDVVANTDFPLVVPSQVPETAAPT